MNYPVLTKVLHRDDRRSVLNIVLLMQLAPERSGLNAVRKAQVC